MREVRGPRATGWSASTTATSACRRQLDGPDATRCADMADDAVAVLDAVGAERAHVHGVSMGGMIVQWLAIDHADRLLSMTSVMSTTGEPEYGRSSPEAVAALTAPPADRPGPSTSTSRSPRRRIYGSKPEWVDEDAGPARSWGAAYDRCVCTRTASRRQIGAITHDAGRAEALRSVTVPDARDARRAGHAHRPERRPPHRRADPRRDATSRSPAWATTTHRPSGTSGSPPGPTFVSAHRSSTASVLASRDGDQLRASRRQNGTVDSGAAEALGRRAPRSPSTRARGEPAHVIPARWREVARSGLTRRVVVP